MKSVKFEFEKKYIKDFIGLPRRLYDTDCNTENPDEVRQLLTGKHPLSKYFTLDKFLIYRGREAVARFVITTYPNDTTAYLGFFECVEEDATAKYVFEVIQEFVKERYDKIIGPVDASFWIKYRLKTNCFDRVPYTGEPYNREYYPRLFQNNGYQVCEHYISNHYLPIEQEYVNEKCAGRYEAFLQKGYRIVSPHMQDFDSILKELYGLLTKLYRNFPIYKDLSLEDFVGTFQSYKLILNPSMVKLAYYRDTLVGFFISVPNYSNKVYHLTPGNLIRIMKMKKNPKEYVMLYLGVDEGHAGLGSALSHSIIEALRENGATSIGALARDGKVTQNYVSDKIAEKYEYVLFERKL